jgi:hypothetical protein
MKTILSFLLLITSYSLNAFELTAYYCTEQTDRKLCNGTCGKSARDKYTFDVNEKKNLIVVESFEKKNNGFSWEKKTSEILDNCKIVNKYNWQCFELKEGRPGTVLAGLRFNNRHFMHGGVYHDVTILDDEDPNRGGICAK